MRLRDKVAVITGATRGIGKEIAEKYAKEGAKVVIIGLTEEETRGCVGDFKEKGYQAYGYKMDVSNKKEVEETFGSIIYELGTIDILVNNAGITADAQLYKMTEEQHWQPPIGRAHTKPPQHPLIQ